MVSVLLIHELFHLFFIKLFKQKITKFELTAFGGMINVKIQSEFLKELLIYSGGLIGNLLIYVFLSFVNFPYENVIFEYNRLMFVINILPIIPLDGMKILELLLEKFFQPRKALKISYFISIITLIIFIIYSISIKSAPFIMMTFLLIYHNICFFKSIDDIILNKIYSNIKRGVNNGCNQINQDFGART